MKIFLDTADITDIIERWDTGLISGITTNPTLVKKSGMPYHALIEEITNQFPELESVSAEVSGETCDEMLAEADTYACINKNVTIKLPLTSDGLKACKILSGQDVLTNVTLCFSAPQAVLTALAGASYISPFVGRMDDNAFGGISLIEQISKLYGKQYTINTQILAASIRDASSVSMAFTAGADVATIPAAVFDKMYKNVLTDAGLNIFKEDFKSVQS